MTAPPVTAFTAPLTALHRGRRPEASRRLRSGTGVEAGAQAAPDAPCPGDSAVDPGHAVDPVHDSPLNQPHSPDQPHKLAPQRSRGARPGGIVPAGGREGMTDDGRCDSSDMMGGRARRHAITAPGSSKIAEIGVTARVSEIAKDFIPMLGSRCFAMKGAPGMRGQRGSRGERDHTDGAGRKALHDGRCSVRDQRLIVASMARRRDWPMFSHLGPFAFPRVTIHDVGCRDTRSGSSPVIVDSYPVFPAGFCPRSSGGLIRRAAVAAGEHPPGPRAGGKPDRRPYDQAARPARVFGFEPIPFPRVAIRGDGREATCVTCEIRVVPVTATGRG